MSEKKKRLVNLGIRDRLCHALEVGDLICRSRGPSRAGEQDNYAALTKETEQSQELFRRAHLVPKARRQERPPLLGDVTPRYGSTTLTGHANVLRPQLGKLPDSPADPLMQQGRAGSGAVVLPGSMLAHDSMER